MDYVGYDLSPILVTGANGYLGGHVLSMLRKRGIVAKGIGRSGQCDIYCDLCDPVATKTLIAQYPNSRIIHCAAAVPLSYEDYFDEVAASASLEMVQNLVDASPRHIVFISSMTVYPEGTILAREEDVIAPVGGYAASKYQAERILLENLNITATILRIPGLFGLPRKGGILFNSALALARGENPTMQPILPQWAALHVEDAADICIRAALVTPNHSVVMNAGYPDRMAISDAVTRLAYLLERQVSVPPPKWFAFNLAKLDAHLGPVSGRFNDRLKDLADRARMAEGTDHDA